MSLRKRGKNTSKVEVENVSKHGIWLLINEKEYFLPYKKYPWFKKAKVADIFNVKFLHQYHLHWPSLDVDLELNSLKTPNEYPLCYQ